MGRRSKKSNTRLSNLSKTYSHQKQSQNINTSSKDEDYTPNSTSSASENSETNPILFPVLEEDVSSSDYDLDPDLEAEEIDKNKLEDLKNEEEMYRFSSILQGAQKLAVKAEREQKEQKPHCPRHYTGNAPQTKQFYAQKRRELAAGGQAFIHAFLKKKAPDPPKTPQNNTENIPEEVDTVSDDEDDDNSDIEEAISTIFEHPEQPPVDPARVIEAKLSEGDEAVRVARDRVRSLLEDVKMRATPKDNSPDTKPSTQSQNITANSILLSSTGVHQNSFIGQRHWPPT
ncbi:hypothetical protein FA15DRAFT_709549 [Coprinopsis marcescibilis]|uniref:Uncharacterized protein n=1 Tax=Coprinopsis marcescibilis TaxID=230819 RepID=A0A5C3KFX7_COPMA|nr:hypothetical protein FA15DRAFT_709549 [Coprinopsis marcescibilis]